MRGMSFVCYTEHIEFFKVLDAETRLAVYDAMYQYSKDGTEPQLTDAGLVVWMMVKNRMDRDADAYDEKCKKNRENGQKGGRPSGKTENPSEPKKPNGLSENPSEPKKPYPEPYPLPCPLPEPDRDRGKPQKTARFIPPTVEEVRAYCVERKNNVNAQKFIDHYEANGWMRGKNKVKDWKACVRTWEDSDAKNEEKQTVGYPYESPWKNMKDGRDYFLNYNGEEDET